MARTEGREPVDRHSERRLSLVPITLREANAYTLPQEGGASLRAAGFKLIGEAGGGTWNRPNSGRPRVDMHPTQEKLRWELAA